MVTRTDRDDNMVMNEDLKSINTPPRNPLAFPSFEEAVRQDSFEGELSSIEGGASHLSRSTAQFRSIERMRDSLVNFERNHKLKTTMVEFHHLKRSLDLDANGKYSKENN